MFNYEKQPVKRRIVRDISTIARCIVTTIDKKLLAHDISRGQEAYMIRILEQPGLSQNDCARLLKVNKAAVSKALNLLEKQGYIERQEDENDKRSYKIYPTDKLLELYPTIYMPGLSLGQIGLKDFSDEDLETFHHLLQRMKKNINLYWLEQNDYDVAYAENDQNF